MLFGLTILGVALRILGSISWWPPTPTLDDGYQLYANSNPFMDPQHPAGYGLIIAALGAVTREVAVQVLLQHRRNPAHADAAPGLNLTSDNDFHLRTVCRREALLGVGGLSAASIWRATSGSSAGAQGYRSLTSTSRFTSAAGSPI